MSAIPSEDAGAISRETRKTELPPYAPGNRADRST